MGVGSERIVLDVIIALIPVIAVGAATAIYYNRQKTNKLYQRLFGLNEDEIDDGYIIEMTGKLDKMDGKLDELNHHRIKDIEEKLEELQSRLDKLTVEEGKDDG